jgi:AcrR family transcriptional regulator
VTQTALRPALDPDPRETILALARTAFADKGFDGASMQDLARAAGMSAGNFYRYFPSKAAIVQALVAREIALIDAGFARIEAAPDPMAAIPAMIRARISGEHAADCAVWAEIVSAAHRRPEIATALAQMEQAVVGHMTRLFALLKQIPPEQALARYGTHARFVVLLVRGVEMEQVMCPSATPELTDMVIAEVTRILSSILNETP